MTDFYEILNALRRAEGYEEKTALSETLGRLLEESRKDLSAEDYAAVAELADEETGCITSAILSCAESYRSKDNLFRYASAVLNLTKLCYPDEQLMPASRKVAMQELADHLAHEQFLETALEACFRNEEITGMDIDELIALATPVEDEYQRGMFFGWLRHYSEKVEELPEDAKASLEAYAASELRRLMPADAVDPASLDEDVSSTLELIADTSVAYVRDELAELLETLSDRVSGAAAFYAFRSLVQNGYGVSDELIEALAGQLEYAHMTYELLCGIGQKDRFPFRFTIPEYLAESDLVHWLSNPAALGQMPDAVEYLGKITRILSGYEYYVFRFKSESELLEEDSRGRWFIGWSSENAGTFSGFDRYEDFDAGTPAKTLKAIKRKLL